ncbi:hypothetical protein [Actinoplanes sp. G11-F43]|uniref:hypothetical protein n=1 Tax=Actinoplanes sp. G11-F43 TaxID=3424130 RepID=UPI003D32BBEE
MPATRALTVRLARTVVAEVAPEELPAFDLLADPYLRGADGSGPSGDPRPGPAPVAETATPIVTMVSAAVAGAVLDGTSAEAEKAGGRLVRQVVAVFRRRPGAPVPIEWTPRRLAELREVARRRALALGLDENAAATLADAVIGALTRPPDPG